MTAHPMTAGESRFEAQEHRDLALGLAHIEDIVERSPELGPRVCGRGCTTTLGWLDHEVRPHMAWEDRWLYPQLDEIAGTPWATRSAAHGASPDRTDDRGPRGRSERWFGHATPQTAAEIVQHLGAIRALIAAHIEREERFLLPLLDDPTEDGMH